MDKKRPDLVLQLLQEPASNFRAAQSPPMREVSIFYKKGKHNWFWTKRAKKMDQEVLKRNKEGVKLCFWTKKTSVFVSKKSNSLVKLALEPAKLLGAWQRCHRATSNCTIGRPGERDKDNSAALQDRLYESQSRFPCLPGSQRGLLKI